MGKWRQNMASLVSADRDPIAPEYVVGLIDELATDDAVLTCDSGTIATWAARGWTIRGDRGFYLSGNLATMAPGLPYAIGIQHAFPGRQVIAYVGDGGFAMLMAEFLTAIQHKLPVTVIINNNNSLGQILWEQMVLGYPEHGVGTRSRSSTMPRSPGANGAWASRWSTPARSAPRSARRSPRRPGHGGRERQPGRAAAAGQGRLRAGQEVRPGFPEGPAAQGHDRDHAVERQDRAAQVAAPGVLPLRRSRAAVIRW
jgi:pyruvate dehydrogenase (quinone)/pyruvate oxidase